MARFVPIGLAILAVCSGFPLENTTARELLPSDLSETPRPAVEAQNARAQYLPPPSASEKPTFIQQEHAAVDASVDADSRGNRDVYVGGIFAPFSGIYESGFRLGITGDLSWYKFRTSDNPSTVEQGHYLEGSVLAGYTVAVPRFSITGLIGGAFGEGVDNGATTDQWGGKAILAMSAKPTDFTMAAASVAYSTIGNSLQAQGKAGIKIFGNIYFGPEIKFKWKQILPWQVNFSSAAIAATTPVSAEPRITTLRIGAHLSAISIGPASLGISGGWAHNPNLGNGFYGSIGLYQPF